MDMYFGVAYVGTVCRSENRLAKALEGLVPLAILTQERDKV